MAIKHQPNVENLLLFRSCDFELDCADRIRQSWDTLRFARMDSLFLTSRPRVKPMKDLSKLDETYRVCT
jgi:hypothetical protein